jgi:hypothetical protein
LKNWRLKIKVKWEKGKAKRTEEMKKGEKGKRKMPGSLNLSTVPEFLLITIMSISNTKSATAKIECQVFHSSIFFLLYTL